MDRTSSSFSGSEQFRYEAHDLEAMSGAANYYRWILDLFGPYKGVHLLEVGAGIGTFSSILLNEWGNELRRYTVLEPDRELYDRLADRLKKHSETDIRVHNRFLAEASQALGAEKIDTILYVNVLEHVEDDMEELKQAVALLEKGGHVLTFTPAAPGLYSRFDEELGHYRRYRLNDMTQKMRKTGLDIVKAHYVDFPGFFLWWLKYKVLESTSLAKGPVIMYDRFVVPILRHADPSRYLPLGKNILVIGEKPG